MGVEIVPATTSAPARRWKPYPSYKESGVEWLGKVPKEWEMKRLKRIFRVVNGSTPKSGVSEYWDGDIAWITPDDLGNLQSDTITETARKITELGYHSCGTTLVPAGSLVLSTRAPIGHLAIAGIDLCTNQGCRALVFMYSYIKRFFYYQLLAARPELESWGQGSTFKELGKSNLEAMGIVSPPSPEQRAIASFLDRQTAHLDALISKKERLIELLEEKRTALISSAVTKGLDPNVAMKDSGVEWLGDVPEQWNIKKLKHLTRLDYGDSLPAEAREVGDVPVYGSNGSIGFHSHANTLAPALVIGRKGSFGKINYSDKPCFAIDTTYFIDSRKTRSDLRWLFYILQLLNLDSFSEDSAVPGLSREFVYGQWVPGIPLPEQRTIASFLDRQTAKIDVLIAKIKDGIDKLHEYRTALISAAVTGKIDVREAV